MTHEELGNYINGLPEIVRESALKEILDSDILAKAFETKDGRAILNSAADLIASDVMQIVRACTGQKSEKLIVEASTEINTTYKLMTDWAKILIKGTDHRNKIG